MTEDRKVSQRYRELPREEPPRHVDDAILAASRRASASRRFAWYIPLATAAIIVLAIAVTVHVERQRPDLEVAEAPIAAPAPPPDEQPQAAKREKSAPRDDARLADLYKATPAPPQPASPPAAAPSRRAEDQSTMGERRAATDRVAAAAARSPEQWLQGIADLRRQGRHEEADRELAEFRKRHPDYRIPEATLEKVEKR
jgi:hypothetical protein